MLHVLDLFSGIGGFSLGLERTGGFRTISFCEVELSCQKVLRRHWPDVPIHNDVRQFSAGDLMERADIVCGGFPCQDISTAGQGAGLNGARSGLWFEMFRVISETRPRYVIIENVAVLRSRGLDTVLGCLASVGYDAEWHCIPAAAVGAPHRRDRVWVVAYRPCVRKQPDESTIVAEYSGTPERSFGVELGTGCRSGIRDSSKRIGQLGPVAAESQNDVANADCRRFERRSNEHVAGTGRAAPFLGADGCDADRTGLAQRQGQPGDARPKLTTIERADWWLVEPDVGRVANGIPARVDRLRALGNSIVPQIAEQIGLAILYSERLQ